jgi:hypothetical protein
VSGGDSDEPRGRKGLRQSRGAYVASGLVTFLIEAAVVVIGAVVALAIAALVLALV